MTLTDADILSRLTNIEDATVERKTMSDFRDSVKAAVAFSNSLPVGDPGIIYIGVYNSGRIDDKGISETTVDKVTGELSNIYPPIFPQILVREKDGKKFIAVIVRGSPNKPHFTGQSYIRQGTMSVPASERQFEELVAMRNSKVAQILKWQGKQVSIELLNFEEEARKYKRRAERTETGTVIACNQFYITFSNELQNLESAPLRRVELSFDHPNNRLKFEIYPI
jgi:predicted HTH transcriptional regulator